jgi:hypothetical protein
VDFTGDIAAYDRRELLDEDSDVLLVPINGVDGDGGVLDDDLACCGCWHRGWSDFERSVGLLEPCGLVIGCGHVGSGDLFWLLSLWKWIDCVTEVRQGKSSSWLYMDT